MLPSLSGTVAVISTEETPVASLWHHQGHQGVMGYMWLSFLFTIPFPGYSQIVLLNGFHEWIYIFYMFVHCALDSVWKFWCDQLFRLNFIAPLITKWDTVRKWGSHKEPLYCCVSVDLKLLIATKFQTLPHAQSVHLSHDNTDTLCEMQDNVEVPQSNIKVSVI